MAERVLETMGRALQRGPRTDRRRAEARYLAVASVAALVVTGAGAAIAGGAERVDALAGGAFAWTAQVVLFLVFSVFVLRHNRLAAYLVSMLGRLFAVALFALLVMPALVLAPVPSLLTMASVLVVMSMLEAALVRPEPAVTR